VKQATHSRGSKQSTVAWIVLGVLFAVVLFAASAIATDRPDFCPSCHEMRPYFTAWRQGPHSDVWCIDCHVEPGMPDRFAHKFVALGEVVSHVRGDVSFPRAAPPSVPDERCLACHETIDTTELPKAFDHQAHEEQGSCQSCHSDTGHDVSERALIAAGIFDEAAAKGRRTVAAKGAVAAPDTGVALAGHRQVACDRCHDMTKIPCFVCHQTPQDHDFKGDCASCHPASADSWAFAHPRKTGEHSWRKMACRKCHPSGYETATCTCHKNGVPKDD